MDYEDTLFNRPKKAFSRSKAGGLESVLSEGKGSAVWLWHHALDIYSYAQMTKVEFLDDSRFSSPGNSAL